MAEKQERPIRVLLADDHVLVRKGIARLVRGELDMEVVGEASDGKEAVDAAKGLVPDVVLMDIGMPGISGIEATRQIMAVLPETRVLILTVYDQEDFLFHALEAGAVGYVLKGAESEDLLTAIRTVHSGELFIYPQMVNKLVRDYLKRLQSGEGQDEYAALSAREREVLPLLAGDSTNDEIADQLHISKYTVQTHRQRIMEKLDLHSRTELLKYALRKGLIRLEQ